MKQEKLFRALGDIGADLVEKAETKTFRPKQWRRWGALAACLALVLCLTAVAVPYLRTMEKSAEGTDGFYTYGQSLESATDICVPESEAPGADKEEVGGSEPQDQKPAQEEQKPMEEEQKPMEEEPPSMDAPCEDSAETPMDERQETVVFDGRKYDVTERYGLDALPESDIGEYLGVTENASNEDWIGCEVYAWRTNGRKAILVKVEGEYLYCTLPLS